MQTIKCFEVMGHTDTTEGRGPMKVVARFSFKDDAVKYVKSKSYAGWCVMGYQSTSDVNNIREATITILDSIDEFGKMEAEVLKARALAKLTVAERQALGF
jgi:hypothetical protein